MTGMGVESLFLPVAKELAYDVLFKATVVLLAAGFLTLVFRWSSAATRYAVWTSALVVLIMVPLISVSVPSWNLGRTVEIEIVPSEIRPVTAQINDEVTSVQPPTAATAEKSAAAPVTLQGSGPDDELESSRAWPALETATAVLVWLWLAVAAFLLLRLAVHVYLVNRLTHRTSLPGDAEISELALSIITSHDIRRAVRIVLSKEAAMPFSWGIFNPVVVFPAGAKDWPAERKRSVLLHELAHVARWDYLVHLLVEIVRALYWPNPLVRIAVRRAAMEREKACDDFALRYGTPSDEYATHLLHIARLQVEQRVPVSAVSMAGEPGLVERIKYVMNKKLDRSPLHPIKIFLMAVVAATAVLPVATLDVLGSRWRVPTTGDVIEVLQSHKNTVARQRAAWWLGEHEVERGVLPLVQGLKDGSASVRLVSAWALGEIKDEASIDALIETLEQDDDVLVREMAALALGEIEDRSAIDPLVAAFDRDKELRTAIIWALGEIANRGSRRAERARDEAFDKMDVEPYENEEVWTGKLPSWKLRVSGDVDRHLSDVADGVASERRNAALNLGLLGVRDRYETGSEIERVVDALILTLRDSDPEVRAAAVWSLDEINPSRSSHFGGSRRKHNL